ncbi:MAG TPA: DUF401 family protein [Firmicutes bacterium]|nr:DUF401 family protein [Bacillota bacterium]
MSWTLPLALALLVMVLGVYFKYNLSLIMLVSSLVIALLCRLTVIQILDVAYLTVTSRVTLILFFSIILLELLGHLLKETGAMQKIIDSLSQLLGDWRLLTAALSAVIGLLAVPGGAIMSAPMIEEVGRKTGFSAGGQAAANFWFRHVLYFALPLFPSMILAAELAGVKVSVFTLYNLPISVLGAVVSFFTIFKQADGISPRLESRASREDLRDYLKQFLFSSAPILVILFLVTIFQVLFPWAILTGIIVAFFSYLPRQDNLWAALKERFLNKVLPGVKFKTALMILGIMFFKHTLEYTSVVSSMAEYLVGTGAPVIILMFLIPFLMGLITGDNSASIAIIIPLFAPFLDCNAPGYLAQLAFLYFSSSLGHIFTPVHPCLVLTKEYFQVTFGQILKPLLLPALLVVAIALVEVIWLGQVL